jgi:hypothetical protein
VSFRRVFPYAATVIVVLGIAAVFAFRPTPFIGLTPDAVASSLAGALAGNTEPSCEETGDGRWSCRGAGGGFDLEINDFGCWTATPTSDRPRVGTPSTVSGCVTLWDH